MQLVNWEKISLQIVTCVMFYIVGGSWLSEAERDLNTKLYCIKKLIARTTRYYFKIQKLIDNYS